MSAYLRDYYQANKERLKQKAKERYALKKEEIKQKYKEYRKSPKGKAAKKRAYLKESNDPIKHDRRKERKRNQYWKDVKKSRIKGCVYQATRRVRLMGIKDEKPAFEKFKRLSLAVDARCAYCGEFVIYKGGGTVDHILPVTRGGNNSEENLCVACDTCNKSKGDKTVEEWRKNDSTTDPF